ncbi:kinase-like domain-containing protein [Lentinula edodes]|nr:kinase-like domain-containing protein [Lentinula edodes]
MASSVSSSYSGMSPSARESDDKDDDEDCEGFERVPILLDHFTVTGPGGDRRHFCLVQNLYSTFVSALRCSSPTNSLPVYMVCHLIYMALQGLTALYSLDIIHTDIKPDNILIHNLDYSDEERSTKFLAVNPVETLENGSPKTQHIPHRWTYKSLDFSPAVDIWAIGYLTFELLVGRCLFYPEGGKELESWSVEDDHLAKMMELTGQQRDKDFEKDGDLLRRVHDLKPPIILEEALRRNSDSESKIPPGSTDHCIVLVTDFIERCLKLDHNDRATTPTSPIQEKHLG